MVKKILVILVTLIILSGCSAKPINIDQSINDALAKPLPLGTNHTKSYFRYYLPLDANLRQSTQVSSLVYYQDSLVLIQLNVSNIVTKQYYSDDQETKPLLEVPDGSGYETIEGVYQDRDGENRNYVLAYKEVGKQYVFVLTNEYVEITTIVPTSNANLTLEMMFTVMRSVQVDEEKVVATFSNKEIINYAPIREEFFEVAIPESGSLIDMYNRLHPDEPIKVEEGE